LNKNSVTAKLIRMGCLIVFNNLIHMKIGLSDENMLLNVNLHVINKI